MTASGHKRSSIKGVKEKSMKSGTRSFALAFVITVAAFATFEAVCADQTQTSAAEPFNPRPWQEDFSQLLDAMTNHYANLEWAVTGRHMNLPKLRETTEQALSKAQSETEARAAMEKFMNAFGDGHLEIDWRKAAPEAGPTNVYADICQTLGYSMRGNGPGVDFTQLPQFSPLPSEEAVFYPGGLLRISVKQTIGIIRIGLLAEKGYPEACESVVKTLGLAQDAKCDSDCGDRVQLAVANYLTAALLRRATALRKAGATSLLLDITGNGGGTNWAEIPPRVLSPVPLHDSKYAFVKSDHWVKNMEERLADVESDLKNNRGPHDDLQSARTRLLQIIEQSKQKCDRSSVWRDGSLHCSQLVKDAWFTSGLLSYAGPESYPGLESRDSLYHPLRYDYTESTDRLPLYVAVDWNTWSAAEYVAAILQDNHAAVIIGTPTGGAGCGYTNGGIPTILTNSQAEVKMPDCVRIRADGSDAVDGVMPDKLIGWSKHDSEYEKAEKLFMTLKALH